MPRRRSGRCGGCWRWPGRASSVLRSPLPALGAILLQCAGWFLQLLAVYVAMRAFDIHAPLPAAALVLLLMNVATIFPLWPGNIGLLQAAVALPLVQYGVAYSTGFAYGLVLQVIEMSVGVGVGLVFLAREGLSFATLRGLPGGGAEADEEAERAGRARSSSVRALACPASLKGVLGAADAADRAGGRAAAPAAPRPSSCPSPTAAKGRPRCCYAALGGDWREADVHDAFGRPRRRALAAAPGRDRRRRGGGGDPARPGPARSARRVEPRLRRARARGARRAARRRSSLCLGGTATMDAGAGLLEVVRELPVPARVACDVARHSRSRRRGSSARRREPARRRWPSSSAASPPDELGRSNTSPAPAPPAASALRSPRSARARAGRAARPRRRRLRRRRASTSSSPARAASTHDAAREGARRGRAPCRRGIRCVVFGGVVDEPLPGRRDASRSRATRPGRATTWSRSATGLSCWSNTKLGVAGQLTRARRPRAAGARAAGRASTRSGRRSRRSAGTPRTSSRRCVMSVSAITRAVRAPSSISAISPK